MDYREQIKQQITEAAANVVYTYYAHWYLVDRYAKRKKCTMILEIILMSATSVGFLSSLLSFCQYGDLIASLAAAFSLGLYLYTINIDFNTAIQRHTGAANELWDIREQYRSLLIDFDELDDNEIKSKRDDLTKKVNCINHNYPGTDEKSFEKARKFIKDNGQSFVEGEAELVIGIKKIDIESKNEAENK